MNMYKFIKIRHDIIKQCHGNYKEMKEFNYKLRIEIFRNSTLKNLGVLRGSFKGFGCPNRHPGALLAKTMHYNTFVLQNIGSPLNEARIISSEHYVVTKIYI